jgi:hypothetical protein
MNQIHEEFVLIVLLMSLLKTAPFTCVSEQFSILTDDLLIVF